MKRVRRIIRTIGAIAIRLNALFLLRIAPPSLRPLAARLHLQLGEAAVLLLLASLSILYSYGWKKLIVDLLYIYFFPFIAIFQLVRLVLTPLFRGEVTPKPSEVIVVRPTITDGLSPLQAEPK